MKKDFIKDLALYAPSQFLPALTAFITTPILTRLLAPAEYGYWAMALSLSALMVALAASGMGSAVIRFYPSYQANGTVDTFFATVGLSLGAVVVGIAGIGFLGRAVAGRLLPTWMDRLLPVAILIFTFQSFVSVLLAVVRAQRRSGLYTFFQLTINYCGLGLGLLLLVVWGLGVEGLLWATLATLLLILPLLVFVTTRRVGVALTAFRLADALSLWRYAWPLALGSIAMWGLRVSDLFIIGALRPARDVGLYSVSYNISARSIELLVALFLLSVSPLIYKTWETHGREATEATLTMATRLYLIICVPAAVGLAVLAFPFVVLLTAPDYYEGSRIVGLVVFSSVIWGLANIAMMGLTIKQKARQLGSNQILAAATHIGLQLLLVPRFGYIASAISTIVGFAVLLVLNATASRPFLAWRFPLLTLRNVIVASGVMGIVTWAIYGTSGGGSRVSVVLLLASIAAAVVTYCLCLWLLGEVNDAEKKAIVAMWDRIAVP